jgi:hypothetical protein
MHTRSRLIPNIIDESTSLCPRPSVIPGIFVKVNDIRVDSFRVTNKEYEDEPRHQNLPRHVDGFYVSSTSCREGLIIANQSLANTR